jgi:hypothetical protein
MAADANGSVAFFTVAEGAYMPEEPGADAMALAKDLVLVRSAHTAVRITNGVAPGLKGIWLEMAERGVFVFDADPRQKRYLLIARPQLPVCLSALSDLARVSIPRLSHLRFGETSAITDEDLRG